MQKKKTSPRNSPRNPSSPRNPGSPRGGGSPRATEIFQGAPGRQSFLTNQDILSAHLNVRESHSKSYRDGGHSPLLEQRKSPFTMLSASSSLPTQQGNLPNLLGGHLNSAEPLHHLGVETMQMLPQCNIDNIALLKSLDPAFLQKYEELKRKLQNVSSAVPNGLETAGRLTKSPGPAGVQSKTSNHNDSHPVNNNTAVSNTASTAHCITNVLTSNGSSSAPSSMSKVNKANSKDQKITTNAPASRSSPGGATSSPNPINSFGSSLPPPKRLTESIQKLLNFPLDPSISLPHQRRSPQSCASVTRTCSSHMTAQCNATTKGSSPLSVSGVAAGATSSRHSSTDSHVDLDSITPSITGMGLGPLVLPLDTSQHITEDTTVPSHSNLPHLIDTPPSNLPYPVVESNLTTKLVPAVKGSIPSHKSGGSVVGSKPMTESQTNVFTNITTTSVPTASVTVENISVCNNDSKMAISCKSISLVSDTRSIQSGTDTLASNALHQQTSVGVRYPSQTIVDKPQIPFSQMGLTEMLQETATIKVVSERPSVNVLTSVESNSASAGQLPDSSSVSSVTGSVADGGDVDKTETIEQKQRACENPVISEKKESNQSSSGEQSVQKFDSDSGKNSTNDNSDIPKLKRQISLSVSLGRSHLSPTISTGIVGSDSCDSDMGKSQDSCSSSSSTPPVLTAVSDIPDEKLQKVNELDLVNKDANSVENSQLNSGSSFSLQSQHSHETTRTRSISRVNSVEERAPPDIVSSKQGIEISEKKVNAMSDETEVQQVTHLKGGKSLRKRRASSESIEDKTDDHDTAPRQLRSRKRTNANENDIGQADDVKRPKLDVSSEGTVKLEPKDIKHTSVNADILPNDEPNSLSDSIKSGLRTRTSSKTQPSEHPEKKAPVVRESRKDTRAPAGKVISEKKSEPVKPEDGKRAPHARRNRQSPSVQTPEKTTPAAGIELSDILQLYYNPTCTYMFL